MTNNFLLRRLLQLGAIFLIGDGVMGLVRPRWYSLLWRFGPQVVRAAAEELAEHPKTARTLYLAEAAVGIALFSLPEAD